MSRKKYVLPFLHESEKRKWTTLKSSKCRHLTSSFKRYLSDNKVYFSLTTSPIRLKKIGTMLSLILEFPYVKEIHLNIPELYRGKDEYDQKDIKFISELSFKIKIFRIPVDIGPLTKILPTIERLKKSDSIIISVDDDIGYSMSLIYELAYHSYKYPRQIFTGSGFDMDNHERDNVPFPGRLKFTSIKGCHYVDIVEGYGGIAYRSNLFDTKMVKKMNALSIDCKLSDDLVISYMLSLNGIEKFEIFNDHYRRTRQSCLYPFKYGEEEDALHLGSGLGIGYVDNANIIKYAKCLKQIDKSLH